MKLHTLVGAVAGIAVCTTSAAAQLCQGDLSFRNSQKHVGAAVGMTQNSTSFGGGLSVGHSKGWFGGGSLGMSSYDGISGHAIALGGDLGYSMPLANKSRWSMCPNASLSLGFGPNFDVGGTKTEMSSQTMGLGLSLGTAVAMSKTFNLLPFGSASFAHTRASIKANGASASGSDNYMVFGAGAGLQFSPSLVVRPSLSLLADADPSVDNTIWGLSLTWAIGH